jgi:hypothetical protein
MTTFYKDHRPELADVVESADLALDSGGLWLQPEANFRDLNPAWLEGWLVAAALEAGLPLAWIRVLSHGRGGEA